MTTFLKMFLSIWSEIQNNCKLWFQSSVHNALSMGNQSLCLEGTQCLHLQGLRVLIIWHHISERNHQPHNQANTSTCKYKPRWNLVTYFYNSTNPRAVLSAITLQVYITAIFTYVDTQTNISHTSCMLGLWATPHKVRHPIISWLLSQTKINCRFFVQSPSYWVFNTNINKNFMHWHISHTGGQNLDIHHRMGTCVFTTYLLIKHVKRISTKISNFIRDGVILFH
jgi:hypothetical protein